MPNVRGMNDIKSKSNASAIWKFSFPIQGELEVDMPTGAKILCFEAQNNVPTIWALVQVTAEEVKRKFCVLGTGQKVSSDICDATYVGTVLMYEGDLVFHLFDLGET